MNKFESIKVDNVLNLTDEAVMITFDTSSSNNFKYYPGQYITIKQNISGEEIRRAYSICSSVNEPNHFFLSSERPLLNAKSIDSSLSSFQ